MSRRIDDTTIEAVSTLAKLSLSEEEKEVAKADIEEMLGFFDQLNKIDTENVEPLSHVSPMENVFREDVVLNGDGRAETLQNAPREYEGQFVVPKTFA